LPAPPYAALELHQDQVRTGHRTPRRPGDLARDKFEVAATWERDGMNGPITEAASLTRIARASLTGKSPRTRHGRWRRDLEYLEMVLAEAIKTLPPGDLQKYGDMVADWRAREPLGVLGRYLAALSRKRRQAREPAP
jgi:hypothetical protein